MQEPHLPPTPDSATGGPAVAPEPGYVVTVAGTSAYRGRRTPWQRLWSDKIARGALVILALFYMLAFFADPITPYGMYFNDPDLANAPATPVHWKDASGQLCWPFVLLMERTFDPSTFQQTYSEKEGTAHPIRLFIQSGDYKIFGFIPCNIHLFVLHH